MVSRAAAAAYANNVRRRRHRNEGGDEPPPPAPVLTITANDAAITTDQVPYNGSAGVTYDGFIDGDTAAVLDGVLSFTGAGTAPGSYEILPTGLTSTKYDIVFAPGTLTVTQALPLTTVTFADVSAVAPGYRGYVSPAVMAPGYGSKQDGKPVVPAHPALVLDMVLGFADGRTQVGFAGGDHRAALLNTKLYINGVAREISGAAAWTFAGGRTSRIFLGPSAGEIGATVTVEVK